MNSLRILFSILLAADGEHGSEQEGKENAE